jgi:4-hydroxybenzoate polyprenyltransferase
LSVNSVGHPAGLKDWRTRFHYYWLLVRADRPIGIFLLLWPALWALWVAAQGMPPWWILVVFVLGTVLMRSAGCAINDYADRDFDGQVERTAQRPLASGLVTTGEALGVFTALSLLAFALVLTLNTKTIAHSFVAVCLAAVYPFTKRYTHVPQLVLGVAFGWAVPMAFTALHNAIPAVAWVLFAATVIWALIYDTMYAMVDRNDEIDCDPVRSFRSPGGRSAADPDARAALAGWADGWARRRLPGRVDRCCGTLRLSAVADP